MKGVFVTGTDTGVGKTLISALLLRAARKAGIDTAPMKPVQTGCSRLADGSWYVPDLAFSLNAANYVPTDGEVELLCPYRYEPACSPHLAGRLAGEYPSIARIVDCAQKLSETHTSIIAEGAGGVLVPLNETESTIDLMSALGWPAVIVARGMLGTINHTLLTVQAVRQAGLEVLGVVFSDSIETPMDDIRRDNPKTIGQWAGVPVLGDIPYSPDWAGDTLSADAWSEMERCVTGMDDVLSRLR